MALYWKNPDPRKYVNIVPTSAISGEGIPDMLQLLVKLTQARVSLQLHSSHRACASHCMLVAWLFPVLCIMALAPGHLLCILRCTSWSISVCAISEGPKQKLQLGNKV